MIDIFWVADCNPALVLQNFGAMLLPYLGHRY